MEPASRLDHNHKLSLREFPYIIRWRDDRCKRCGRCTAVCPVKAIEPTVKVMRIVRSEGPVPTPASVRQVVQIVEQVKDMERYCTGCGTCTLVCPNEAIEPELNPQNKFLHYKNKGGDGYKRGGRRNDPAVSTLDRLKFTRISMLTDPALDAGRHEFRVRTLLRKGIHLSRCPLTVETASSGWTKKAINLFRRCGRYIPIMIGSMSIGALSPPMWEGLAMGVAYLNEVEGMPVVMCSGEGGMPPRLLRSRYLKYFIIQIASGYFGWDEIIHAIPHMVEDPAAIEIKYGQGAKPGDGGLLMAQRFLS